MLEHKEEMHRESVCVCVCVRACVYVWAFCCVVCKVNNQRKDPRCTRNHLPRPGHCPQRHDDKNETHHAWKGTTVEEGGFERQNEPAPKSTVVLQQLQDLNVQQQVRNSHDAESACLCVCLCVCLALYLSLLPVHQRPSLSVVFMCTCAPWPP